LITQNVFFARFTEIWKIQSVVSPPLENVAAPF